MSQRFDTILFDLDGTLADTALDLAWALNQVREEEGLAPLPFVQIRPSVSHGTAQMIRHCYAIDDNHPEFNRRRDRLLAIYADNVARHTVLFPGMHEVLDAIESSGRKWGVVTNKPRRFTEPLMAGLGLEKRAASVVSGDTLKVNKPHPEPLLYACHEAGSTPEVCLYVGDAQRDIEAGKSAGMATMVALFGYISASDRPDEWNADYSANVPGDVWVLINRELRP